MSEVKDPDYKVLFESAPGLFLVLDHRLKIIAVSEAYLKATLTERSLILGRNIFDVFPDNPEDPDATGVINLRTSLERVLSNRMPDTMAVQKYDIRKPDSEGGGFEVRYWSPVNTPVFSEENELLYIIHRVEDVTEFVRVKEEGTKEHRRSVELKTQADRMAAEVYERAHQLQDLNKQLRSSNEALVAKEVELQSLYDKLFKLDQLKTQFFANISHELRTPLTLILVPVQRMLSSKTLSQPQERYLQIVEKNARTLLKHVNDLLDISKLDAGKMVAHYSDVDLANLFRQIASNFDALAQERHYLYKIDGPETLFTQVDPEKFQRILLNLLSNAFKFTPPGGTIHCSLVLDGDKLVLTVADSGPGIPKDLRESIFERFFQVEESATRTHGGTGLGLSIVKDFVGLHGGTVHATGAPEGGALFTVVLPYKAPSKQISPQEPMFESFARDAAQQSLQELNPIKSSVSSEFSDSKKPLILVVEDNPEMNSYICETLSESYRTQSAFNGQEGLEKALELHPDLILSDIMMPVFSGPQMIAELKKTEKIRDIPVIVLSARLDDEMRISTLQQGVQDYVVKPFSPEELTARVHNVITLKKVRDMLQQDLMTSQQDLVDLTKQLSHQSHELQQSLELTRTAMLEADRASQFKNQFLANISHEIRTPLGIVLGFAEILANNSLDANEKNEYVARMRQSGQHLLQILSDILDVAKIETGQLAVENDVVSLENLFKDLNEQFEERVRQKGLQFKILHSEKAPEQFRSDDRKLHQILSNLLDNAIKFSEAGTVTLSVEKGRADSSVLLFKVQDQGHGIRKDYQSHLFDTFSQENGALTRQFGGLGLGLALSHRLASALSGELRLEKSDSEGSVFVLEIPWIGVEDSMMAEEQNSKVVSLFSKPADKKPLQGVKVLVVDDSPDIQIFLGQMLQNAGALSEKATDGVEGVKKALMGHYDVLLMDMQMPHMTGYEATAVLRSKGIKSPIVAVTAHALAEDRERCLESGCDDYLAKPVESAVLIKTIQDQLGKGSSHRAGLS